MDCTAGVYHSGTLSEESESEDDRIPQLFEAVRRNQLDVARHLVVNERICPNVLSSRSTTPLYLALDNQNIALVRMLLDHGADVNQASYCHTYCTYEMPIVTAARLQNTELVEILLQHDCKMEGTIEFREGKTALQWAASHGNVNMAALLLQHGANINWIGMYFHTALHYATISNKAAMVQWLLDNDAEVTINGDGRTPLHIAAMHGSVDIVRSLLLHPMQLDTMDNLQFTPLSLSCLRGHLSTVKVLMENKPKSLTFNLSECLRKASESGHVAVVDFLLASGADVNESNDAGETALGLAAQGQCLTTQLLLKHGAYVNVVDNRGYTPLQQALMRDQREISANLIRHGADLNSHNPLIDSPLHIAFTMFNPILVKYIIQAGCKLSNEPWFQPRAVQQKIQELDFQVPALMRFRPENEANKQAWIWVKQTFRRTRSLVQFSRITIRDQLVLAGRGASILPRIDKLPLPETLKGYLSFTDIFNEY